MLASRVQEKLKQLAPLLNEFDFEVDLFGTKDLFTEVTPYSPSSPYSASKAGILGFTKSVALELGSRSIRCNAIAPGFIETEMTEKLNPATVQGWRDTIPLKRGGSPEDVANACVFLASDLSSYVTGQTLNVCGGMITA